MSRPGVRAAWPMCRDYAGGWFPDPIRRPEMASTHSLLLLRQWFMTCRRVSTGVSDCDELLVAEAPMPDLQ